MTIEEMRQKKRELGYSNETIAEKSGVPLSTVQKIFAGETQAPRQRTVEALEMALTGKYEIETERGKTVVYSPETFRPPVLRDDPATSARMESWKTLDDYYALPDDRRVELIDGEFYDMAAPSGRHQTILIKMALQLDPCVEAHPGCRLFIAPFDVRLDNDNFTVVQPDLLITCHKDRDPRRLNGAPDFVTEILSPSSRAHDMFLKLGKYKDAGVREYWIVDPKKERITVYDLEHEELPESYTFSDTVPLGISDGACSVDFARIREALERYGEI